MNNSATPIGENGRKEVKVTRSNEADKLLDKFFEDLREEGYGKIDVRALVFDVPEVSIKSKVSEDGEKPRPLSDINVLENGKRDFVLEDLAKGAGINIKLADLRKVKAKADKIRKENAEKKSKDAEKTADEMDRE